MTEYLPAIRPIATPAVPVAPLTPFGSYRNTQALARHARQVDLVSRRELINTNAMGEVAHAQLGAEMSLLFHGMSQAGDNDAMLYLVASKVATYSEANNTRLRDLYS